MKRFLILSFACLLNILSLSSCTYLDPTTGQPAVSGQVTIDNSIMVVERSFTLAMQVANLYTSLPRCDKVEHKLCSDRDLVLKIRNAAIKTHDLILEARKNQLLIGAAVNAVSMFGNLIPKT